MNKPFVAALVLTTLTIGHARAESTDCIKYIPDGWRITEDVRIELDAVVSNKCVFPHRVRVDFALHEYHEHGKIAATDSELAGNGIEAQLMKPGEALPVKAFLSVDTFMITQKPYVNGLFATHEIHFVDAVGR